MDLEASFWAPIEPVPGAAAVVIAPLLDATRVFSSNAFAEKYPARNRGAVPATALRLEALEKFRVTDREGVLAVCKMQDRHTVPRPLDRKALAAGYRIIIARFCVLLKTS